MEGTNKPSGEQGDNIEQEIRGGAERSKEQKEGGELLTDYFDSEDIEKLKLILEQAKARKNSQESQHWDHNLRAIDCDLIKTMEQFFNIPVGEKLEGERLDLVKNVFKALLIGKLLSGCPPRYDNGRSGLEIYYETNHAGYGGPVVEATRRLGGMINPKCLEALTPSGMSIEEASEKNIVVKYSFSLWGNNARQIKLTSSSGEADFNTSIAFPKTDEEKEKLGFGSANHFDRIVASVVLSNLPKSLESWKKSVDHWVQGESFLRKIN